MSYQLPPIIIFPTAGKKLPAVPAFTPPANTMPALPQRRVKSSHVQSIGYDSANSHLQVVFSNG
ncbi:MAG: KTSC domain-containing protein, partial [Patescibacteria group bacterium]|nr:KTSC domain-containing protein [Patescibacteria group bacterium]